MVPSPHRAPSPSRARVVAPPLLLAALALAGVVALVTSGGRIARAAGDPQVTVSVKSGTTTQTTFTVVASNFPANTSLTETFGDGSTIDPTTGQTDANGSMTRYWTLNVANKYCGTITAKSDTAQASASFWVAPTSDSQSGTPCDGGSGAGTSSGSATPDTTATAAAQATAAATAAPTQTPIPQPTAAPANGTGVGGIVQRLMGSRLLLLVAGGAILLVIIIIVLIALAAGMRKSGQRGSTGRQPASWNGGWGGSPTTNRQAAQGWRQQGGAPYGSQAGPRYQAPDGSPQQAPRTAGRMPAPGQTNSRWRVLEEEEHNAQQGAPDPRWSRSQPGARGGGRGPAGEGTQARIRTLRDFTEHRQSVRPPGYRDDTRRR